MKLFLSILIGLVLINEYVLATDYPQNYKTKMQFNALDEAVVTPEDSIVLGICFYDQENDAYDPYLYVYPADSATIQFALFLEMFGGEGEHLYNVFYNYDAIHFYEVSQLVRAVTIENSNYQTLYTTQEVYIKCFRGPTFATGLIFRKSNNAMGDSAHRALPQLTDGKINTCPQIPISWYGDTTDSQYIGVDTLHIIAKFNNPVTLIPDLTIGD